MTRVKLLYNRMLHKLELDINHFCDNKYIMHVDIKPVNDGAFIATITYETEEVKK
jgi:hypothetical protein